MRQRTFEDAEGIILRPWQELVGELVNISTSSDDLRLVVRIRPKLLAVTIPQEALIGDIPNEGNKISLLHTDRGYHVKVNR